MVIKSNIATKGPQLSFLPLGGTILHLSDLVTYL